MSVVSKLAFQINAKRGVEPWATNFNLPGLMVVGLNAYHQGKNKGQSTIGFVGWFIETLSKDYSRAFVNNEEE